jgi:hypothetical protein
LVLDELVVRLEKGETGKRVAAAEKGSIDVEPVEVIWDDHHLANLSFELGAKHVVQVEANLPFGEEEGANHRYTSFDEEENPHPSCTSSSSVELKCFSSSVYENIRYRYHSRYPSWNHCPTS